MTGRSDQPAAVSLTADQWQTLSVNLHAARTRPFRLR